jgi:hypothetical protein
MIVAIPPIIDIGTIGGNNPQRNAIQCGNTGSFPAYSNHQLTVGVRTREVIPPPTNKRNA